MKRKTLAILGAIVAVLTLVLFVLQAQSASARNITLKEILFPQIAPAQVGQVTPIVTESVEPTATVFPEGMSNPPTTETNLATINPNQMEKNEAVIETAKPLIEKAENAYLTPGWLHISSKVESFFSESTTLPDGSPVPTEWQDDNWTLLDENGYALQYVGYTDTGIPATSQIVIFKDGIWTNITVGVGSTKKETYRPTLDGGFLADASSNINTAEPDVDEDMIGSEPVTVFTLTEKGNNPVEIGKSGYLMMGTVSKYFFSKDTGLVLKVEQFHIGPDGQYKLVERITLGVTEKVKEPPAQFLKYLE